MGRRSLENKKEKRKRQKRKKKSLKLSSECSSEYSSLSDECSDTRSNREQDFELLGIDETIFTYAEDDKSNFQKYCSEQLTREELIDHLRKCNYDLAKKARFYQKKYEDARYAKYDVEGECD